MSQSYGLTGVERRAFTTFVDSQESKHKQYSKNSNRTEIICVSYNFNIFSQILIAVCFLNWNF